MLNSPKRKSKWEILAVIIIIALAFILRIWDLGSIGFNGDESIYSGQAASLLNEEEFLKNFGLFRAHPLLLQSMVSIVFAIFGIHDTVARLVPVIFGTLTIFVTYLVGKELFHRNVGLASSFVLALLPFHIFFSRQVLPDVPLSFFVTIFLYFITKYKITGNGIYCYWTGVSCGLCFISKEVGIITVIIFVAYTLITHTLKLRKLIIFLSGFISGAFPYFLLMLTREDAMNAFFLYGTFQLHREATPLSLQYPSILINEAFGYVLPILCIISVLLILRESRKNSSKQYIDQIILLGLTIGIIFFFYQVLPSKGDRFMITLVPPTVILGCAFLVSNSVKHWRVRKLLYIGIIPLILLSNNFLLSKVLPVDDLKISDNLGTPWRKEAALWIKDNISQDSGILTSETRLSNIIRFYSNHDVYSIEINPNPSYTQVNNPTLLILNKNVTVIVEDLDPKFSQNPQTFELRGYLDQFNTRLVFTAFKHTMENGTNISVPMIKVYQLR
jgi:4-amino-4-deoxy-L-arabinose transferase-like glycosyltransferase